MSFDFHLSMNEQSLAPFRAAWQRAMHDGGDDAAEALDAFARLDGPALPEFLRPQLSLIPQIAELLVDPEWESHPASRRGLAGALAYFTDPADLIPDSHPVFGLLDDAIVIELALADNDEEWAAWQDYRSFRAAHGSLGPMNRERWLQVRGSPEFATLRARAAASYVEPRYVLGDRKSAYRLLDGLPRIDLH